MSNSNSKLACIRYNYDHSTVSPYNRLQIAFKCNHSLQFAKEHFPRKQSRSANVSPTSVQVGKCQSNVSSSRQMSVQHQFNIELTLD